MRELMKTVESAPKINARYDIYLPEIKLLGDMAISGKLFEAIVFAFQYGYVLGGRAEKAEQKSKQRKNKVE